MIFINIPSTIPDGSIVLDKFITGRKLRIQTYVIQKLASVTSPMLYLSLSGVQTNVNCDRTLPKYYGLPNNDDLTCFVYQGTPLELGDMVDEQTKSITFKLFYWNTSTQTIDAAAVGDFDVLLMLN